jgi:aldehyde:ferredoxin oxidoreductase
MLKTYEEQSVVAAALEEMGMDGEETGGIVAWAMDLYEHGIITRADLDGIDLKWGDLDAALELMKKIAHRKGKAPNALADGFWRASPDLPSCLQPNRSDSTKHSRGCFEKRCQLPSGTHG